MNFEDVRLKAKENIGLYCKACKVCNGIACKGVIPGPGAKGSGEVFVRNYDQLRKVKIEMDTIFEEGDIDPSLEIFGKKFNIPVFAAPIGGVQIHYKDIYDDRTYTEAIVKGCVKAGISGFTGDGEKEEVFQGTIDAIKSVNGMAIPTIKPWKKEEVKRKLRLAEESGAFAVAMDVDAAGLSILGKFGKVVNPLSTADLKEIISETDLPFIIKGVMTVKGAIKAYEAGASGIVVSNHGGRVLDDTPSTIEVLPEIVKAVGGKLKIFIDGAFRSGNDVFKAIALGADAVLIGRPFAVAVYGADEEGVELYSNKIAKELIDVMKMTGTYTLNDISEKDVRIVK
ncbi:MAG: alpha-hydroxy-acid oxidizing protein [Firmicutes bacterium]|jgi:isopentenyl diphosphate isomerase/L-lactate dehydrogenase-like FMN-dependent dehydrogenase|nr:alpha-hydroxy-acid oxidizing protein [Bacillota bacterium]